MADQKPKYEAVILSPTGDDFGPVNLSDARDDTEAGNLAMERGAQQIGASGLDKANIHITKDGNGFRTIPVESRK